MQNGDENMKERTKRLSNLFWIAPSGNHYAALPASTPEFWGNWVSNNMEFRLVSCNLILGRIDGVADVVDVRWDIYPPQGSEEMKPEEQHAAEVLGLSRGRLNSPADTMMTPTIQHRERTIRFMVKEIDGDQYLQKQARSWGAWSDPHVWIDKPGLSGLEECMIAMLTEGNE